MSNSVETYWRIIWAIPSVIAIIQSVLVLTIFNYDTPYELKKEGQSEKLYELMHKIY